MPEVRDRFESLSRTRAPDLWEEIGERRLQPLPQPPTRPRIIAAVLAFVIAAAGFAGVALVLAHTIPTPRTGATVANGRIAFVAFDGSTWQIYSASPDGSGLAQLTHVEDPSIVSEPAWSPDGSRIAYVVQRTDPDGTTGHSDIWVMNDDGSDAHAITGGSGSSWSPAWSPDGSRVAFVRGSDVYLMRPDGTDVTQLTGDPLADREPTWSPDGSSIAFIGRSADDDVYVMSSDGSELRPLFVGPGYQSELAWSPDGATIAFANVTEESGSEVGDFTLIDPTGSIVGHLSGLPPNAQAPAWSPDGRQIVFMANVVGSDREAIYVMNADGSNVLRVPDLPRDASWPAWQPAVASEPAPSPSMVPDGSITASGSALPEGSLLVQVDERRVEVLDEGAQTSTLVGRDLIALDLSPDGSRILVSTPWDSVGPESALVSLDLSTGERTTIAPFDGWSLPARWSPDGSMVAYRVGEQNTLCVRDLAIAEPRCMPELGGVYELDWSPDGTQLVLDQPPPGSLTVLDIATERTTVVARWDDRAVVDAVAGAGLGEPVAIQFQGPRWSPSGRSIAALAMIQTEQGHTGNILFAFDLNGDVIAHGVPFGEFSEARGWSPAADVFAYASGEPPYRIVDARLLDVSTGGDRLLVSTGDETDQIIYSLAWSPSGRWVAIAVVAGSGAFSEIRVLDTTGVDPPATFRSLAPLQLIDWGP